MTAYSVLVVEDDDQMRDAIEAALEGDGISVRTARDANQALQLVEERRPDLILVDLMMPVGGGWELVRQLRASEANAGVRLVMMSALRTVQQEAEELGVASFLKKPFGLQQLLGAVREARVGS